MIYHISAVCLHPERTSRRVLKTVEVHPHSMNKLLLMQSRKSQPPCTQGAQGSLGPRYTVQRSWATRWNVVADSWTMTGSRRPKSFRHNPLKTVYLAWNGPRRSGHLPQGGNSRWADFYRPQSMWLLEVLLKDQKDHERSQGDIATRHGTRYGWAIPSWKSQSPLRCLSFVHGYSRRQQKRTRKLMPSI